MLYINKSLVNIHLSLNYKVRTLQHCVNCSQALNTTRTSVTEFWVTLWLLIILIISPHWQVTPLYKQVHLPHFKLPEITEYFNPASVSREILLFYTSIRRKKGHCRRSSRAGEIVFGNSSDKRSDAYSAEQVLPNMQQIWCGGAYMHCYLAFFFNQTNTADELPPSPTAPKKAPFNWLIRTPWFPTDQQITHKKWLLYTLVS